MGASLSLAPTLDNCATHNAGLAVAVGGAMSDLIPFPTKIKINLVAMLIYKSLK